MWGWRQWPGEGWHLYVWHVFMPRTTCVFYYQRHFDLSFHKANWHLGHYRRTVSHVVSESGLESYANTETFLFFPFKYTCICGILKHVILAYNKSVPKVVIKVILQLPKRTSQGKSKFKDIKNHWKCLQKRTSRSKQLQLQLCIHTSTSFCF